MTLRIPSGTRDVLPEEMRALRRITGALMKTFDRFGYGEISTPAVEYEETLRLAHLGLSRPTGWSTTTARCSRCAPT